MTPQQNKRVSWIAICIAGCAGFLGVAGFEGMRTTPYYDVGGIPTACFGETEGVEMTDRFTRAQCETMLGNRIERDYGPGVDRCTKVELPPKRKAAMVSFAYNLGVGRYCRSIAPLLNAGKTLQACTKLLEFVYAGGVKYPGLVTRRKQEYLLCTEGLT